MAIQNIAEEAGSTLHLPRILCLHGGGSNARIFRAQCRVLNAHLRTAFRLCFVDAPFASAPGPCVVSVYREFGPFRCWVPEPPQVDPRTAAATIFGAIRHAIESDDRKGADGTWVAVLGFSQGAKLAASMLLHQQLGQGDTEFRFGVLFAGSGPVVSLDKRNELGLASMDGHKLDIPTIHVHGLRDPGLERHRRLLEGYSDRKSARLIEWDGEHRVPLKSRDVGAVVRQIMDIARQVGVIDEDPVVLA